ncbi:flavin reductase family protein [Lacticigenium naphthae]|uniref:flavin reductase family protein n=1 Tax=Lacticigenium naphthae TaxID=515351 RepID=UPI000416708F|nr:flavin reductase family protein [Lacticigenium naphthae]
MQPIDPSLLTERENYKFLTGSIIPRPIAFVTTLAEDGTVNAAPFSYFSIVSADPPLISLAIQRKDGELKDTARNIRAKKEFVVHSVDKGIVRGVNQTAANLPANESEIALTHFTPIESTCVAVPAIFEAKVRMECRLEKVIEITNNDQVTADLVIGRIVQYHIEEELYSNGRIDPHGLNAVSRLAGINYAEIGTLFPIDRPL